MIYRFFLETEIAVHVDLNKQGKQFGAKRKGNLLWIAGDDVLAAEQGKSFMSRSLMLRLVLFWA